MASPAHRFISMFSLVCKMVGWTLLLVKTGGNSVGPEWAQNKGLQHYGCRL
jgi:hypothetical protein